MENQTKTLIFVLLIAFIAVISAVIIQLNGQSKVSVGCSYLDPIAIDLLAFSAAIFLVSEGVYSILKTKNLPLRSQLARSIRIAFGLSIATLHILQFLHK